MLFVTKVLQHRPKMGSQIAPKGGLPVTNTFLIHLLFAAYTGEGGFGIPCGAGEPWPVQIVGGPVRSASLAEILLNDKKLRKPKKTLEKPENTNRKK